MSFPLLNDRHPARRAAQRARLLALLGTSGVLAGLALACGEAAPGASLLTIAECQELGGSPFFDPADERPLEMSCPDGLGYLGEFDEPFFGDEGGICCADDAEAAESAAVPSQ